MRDGDAGRARETLAQCPPTLRAWEWDYLLRQCSLAQAGSRKEGDRIAKAQERAGSGTKSAAYRWDEGRILRGHKSWVSSVKFSPDDRLIATGSGDGSVKIWDAATGQPLKTFVVNPGPVHGVAFSPSGLRVASAGNDSLAKIWDVRSGKILVTLRGHGTPVADVSYRPDGKRIATASMDGTIKIWDAMNGKVLASLEGHGGAVGGVCYSPDGHRVASASEDSIVRVWDADTGGFLLALRGHSEKSEKVAYSADGRRIASTSKDGTVRIWDATTGKGELTLRSHSTLVIGLAFSPDGRRIASAGWDCVRLWDAATGREVLNLEGGHTTAFSHDGRRLLSNHGEGGIEAVVRDAREGEVGDSSPDRPAPPPSDLPRRGPGPTALAPGPKPKLIPIYQLNHPSDLLLTTNAQEVEEVSQKGKYRLAAVGYGFGEAQPGTVQLWRYFVVGRGRHLYTTSKMEVQGIQGGALNVWVYPRSRQGTVPVTDVLSDGGVFYVYPKDPP